MDIYETGRHDLAAGVDYALCVFIEVSDGSDAAFADSDVGAATRCSRPIDDAAPFDERIEHVRPPAGLKSIGKSSPWETRLPIHARPVAG